MIRDFQIVAKLGEGAYSTVYKVKRAQDSLEYALKRVKIMNLTEKEKLNALNEVRILASVRHPNIVCYKEVFIEEDTNYLCIVMEFADHGDLYQKIVENQKKGFLFSEPEIWNMYIQMVRGLKALHDLNILHRDLKSANVFLSKNGVVKLGDLNVSKIAKKGLLYTQTGTPYYASPEVWKDQPYDSKSDIWSLGCVLYEMITLKPPFRAEDMEQLYKKVIKGNYPKIPGHFSQDLNNLLKAHLQVVSQLRPGCDQLLQMSSVVKRMKDDHLVELDEAKAQMMKTIKFPKDLNILTNKLPKPNYRPLKTKRLDKERFLMTLAGYIGNDNDHEEEISNRAMTLPKIHPGTSRNVSLPPLKSKDPYVDQISPERRPRINNEKKNDSIITDEQSRITPAPDKEIERPDRKERERLVRKESRSLNRDLTHQDSSSIHHRQDESMSLPPSKKQSIPVMNILPEGILQPSTIRGENKPKRKQRLILHNENSVSKLDEEDEYVPTIMAKKKKDIKKYDDDFRDDAMLSGDERVGSLPRININQVKHDKQKEDRMLPPIRKAAVADVDRNSAKIQRLRELSKAYKVDSKIDLVVGNPIRMHKKHPSELV